MIPKPLLYVPPQLPVVRSTLQQLYNASIRRFLPRKIGVYNGVAIRRPRLFDRTDVVSNVKTGFVNAVREVVTHGDDIVEIGTGGGIGAVWAARQSACGHIHTYEGSARKYKKFKQTMKTNEVGELTTPHHAIVRPDKTDNAAIGGGTYQGNLTNRVISIDNLPEHDVCMMDCEGHESELVPSVTADRVIIETHGTKGSPTSEVVDTLESKGYEILNIFDAEPSIKRDNKVVTAYHG